MLLLLFIRKDVFMFIFHCFLIVMQENHAPFSLNFSSPMTDSFKDSLDIPFFPHDRFLQGKILQHSPLPSAPPPNKIFPPENVCTLPITITICKYWSKFVTCSPSPRDCGGLSHPQRHSYYSFRLSWTKWLSQNFDPLTLGTKWAWEGA